MCTLTTCERSRCRLQVLEVKGLIGYFDLDPNRAIALALQAYAAQPGNAAFLQLFPLFVPDSVAQTLGFLFQHAAAQEGKETPDSLFAVAVSLIQARLTRGFAGYNESDVIHFTSQGRPECSLMLAVLAIQYLLLL